MGKNVKTMNVTYKGGSPVFDPPPGPTSLDSGDWVTVQLASFPAGSQIDRVTFWHNKTVGGVDQKDLQRGAGEWTRSGGNDPSLTVYQVSADSGSTVKIEDVEHPSADDKYWFSVGMSGPGGPWSVDPELINKRKD